MAEKDTDRYRPGPGYDPTLEDRKRQALEFIRLGMKPYEALLLVDCSDREIASLEDDPAFAMSVLRHTALRKKTLLGKMDEVMKDNTENRGITTELRWLLENLHPEDFGKRIAVQGFAPDLPDPVVRERD
jgi:hypothetical protein